MADPLAALDQMTAQVAALNNAATSGRSKFILASTVQPVARALAKAYFEGVRPDLAKVQNRSGLVDEIDFVLQSILQLAEGYREKTAYLGQINELRPYLREATIDLMKWRGAPSLVLSDTEKAILETLSTMLPISAASYEQALRDISNASSRVSWRGTAGELREVLREVIDHLAPDDKVTGAPGYQNEEQRKGPTQRQKVRFILRARRSGSAALTVAEGTLETAEEAVATLARSTYQRGSASTHASAGGKEVRNLKRYVEALLAELLEIS